jgi:uncharacterized protein (TIGR02001 family)
MKKLIAAAGVAALVSSVPSLSAAQAAGASPHSLTGNLTLVTEYRYRGISQTDFRPALQGGFDYAHSSGFYAGTWGSNISWLSDQGSSDGGSSLELDFYGGFKNTVGDFGYDVGVLYYYYPGKYDVWTAAGNPKPNTTELYIAGSWKMLTLKYSYALTDLFGVKDSDGSDYLDLSANFDLGAGFTLGAHVGHQKIKNSSNFDYTDWKIGVSKDYAGFTWGLNYVDTDTDAVWNNYRGKNLGKGTVVLSVGKTF